MSACWLCGGRCEKPVAGEGLRRCGGCGLLSRPLPAGGGMLTIRPDVLASRAQLFEKLLGLVERGGRKGRLLDVGCGSGDFMERARARGWDVEGVEPEPLAAAPARVKGLTVHASLGEVPARDFDAATFWDSLDWMEEPGRELRAVFGLLKPGSPVFARVRNAPFHLFLRRLSGFFPLSFLRPLSVFHRYGFSAATLARALRAAGFVDVEFSRSPLASPGAYVAGPLGRAAAAAAAALGARPSLLVRARKPRG